MPKTHPKRTVTLREVVEPVYCLFCSDCIVSHDGSTSYIRLIDNIYGPKLPITIFRMSFVVEFKRLVKALPSDISMSISIVNPSGVSTKVGVFSPEASTNQYLRMIIELNTLQFRMEGEYKFQVFGKIGEAEESLLLERTLNAKIGPT